MKKGSGLAYHFQLQIVNMERKKYYRGIKLCPKCGGEGIYHRTPDDAKYKGKPICEPCKICGGSGRIYYDTVVSITEKPYEGEVI